MSGYTGKATNWNRDIHRTHTQAERDDLFGPMPAEVVAYDHTGGGKLTVQPLFKKRKYDGTPLEFPQLQEVPVDWPRTGSGALTFPIPVGTRVMLTPQMRSMENYDDADDGTQSDARSFNLSDMRASLAGGDTLAKPLENIDPDNTHLRFAAGGDYGIRGSPEGKIAIEGSQGNIYDLLATVVELLASDGLNVKSGSSAGNGIHELQHRAQYAEIAGKLRAMAL